jgi:hypothetical protein
MIEAGGHEEIVIEAGGNERESPKDEKSKNDLNSTSNMFDKNQHSLLYYKSIWGDEPQITSNHDNNDRST